MMEHGNLQSRITWQIFQGTCLMGITLLLSFELLIYNHTLNSATKILNLLDHRFQMRSQAYIDRVQDRFARAKRLSPMVTRAAKTNDYRSLRKVLKSMQSDRELQAIALILQNGRVISGGGAWTIFTKVFTSKELSRSHSQAFWRKESKSYILTEPILHQDRYLGHFIALMNLKPLENLLGEYRKEVNLQGFQDSSIYFKNFYYFTGENLSFGHYSLMKQQNQSLLLKYLKPVFVTQHELQMPDNQSGFIGCIIPEGEVLKPVYQAGLLGILILLGVLSLLLIRIRYHTGKNLQDLRTSLSIASNLSKFSLRMSRDSDSVSRGMLSLMHEQAKSLEETSNVVGEIASTSTHQAQRSRDLLDSVSHTAEQTRDYANLLKENFQYLEHLCAISSEIKELTRAIRETSNRIDLVAINASIEAVRAGPRGQEFANVAEEVERLAQNAVEQSLEIDHKVQQTLEISKLSLDQTTNGNQAILHILQNLNSSKLILEDLTNEARVQSEKILQSTKTLISTDRKASRNQKVADQTAAHSMELVKTMENIENVLERIHSLVGTNEDEQG